MITKERLQELINKKAIIWHDDYGEIKLDKETCEICETLAFDHNSKAIHGHILQFHYVYENEKHVDDFDIDELEEDVETAKWNYENTRTRIETLTMPTYEKFVEKSYFDFISKDGANIVLSDTNFFEITEFYDGDYVKTYFKKELTKENYKIACEICLKLFTGEKV